MITELEKQKYAELWDEPEPTLSMHPQKFALWLFLVTVVMFFAALTSAYIVRRVEGRDWLAFELPSLFWITSVVIILSSVTMHWAYFSAQKDKLTTLKTMLLLTATLGVVFLVGQFYAWIYLVDHKIFFAGKEANPAGSFLYILTGLHGIHLVSAIVFLLIVLFLSFNYKIHAKSLLTIEMCTTYWHFLSALWIYLFIFLVNYH